MSSLQDEAVRLTRRGRLVVACAVIAVIIVVPVIGGSIYLRTVGFFGDSDPGRMVEFTIDQGSSAQDIGKLLEREGVIESATGFRLAVLLEGGAEGIQAGHYELRTGLTARDALAALLDEGPFVEFVDVTFPEGSWLTDFASILDRRTHLSGDRFLKLATSGKIRSVLQPDDVSTLEGLLFPSTYQIVESDTERSVLTRLIEQMEKEAEVVGLEAKSQELGLTPYETIIVASMIEGEASAAGDRDKVARVIYNRIEQGMKLEIDATVLYALGEHKEELLRSDLEVDSPYNTRLYPGLPPTPIGASGAASLAAAVDPAEGDWVFYVLADCEGNHFFTPDYTQFLRAKADWQALDC
ncbi:MAG TPA: endolytic transglycosylase MltG [Actinomycetota bacterium]|nr:endolytic transglycosylase MltG [Actinomycetota bacterium]